MASIYALAATPNCAQAVARRRLGNVAVDLRPLQPPVLMACPLQPPVLMACQRLRHTLHEGCRSSSSRRAARLLPLKAASHAAAGEEEEGADEEEHEEPGSSDQSQLELILPEKHYQKKLGMKDIKALRTQSNTLAQEGTIQRMTCGQRGITQTFLQACMDSLCKHGFLRVKLGEGSGLERDEAAQTLERYLDAVAVHQIGFTITLYREPGLPRPSNLPEAVQPVTTVEVEVPEKPAAAGTKATEGTEAKTRIPRKRANARSAERAAAAKAAAKNKPKGPPEFSVV